MGWYYFSDKKNARNQVKRKEDQDYINLLLRIEKLSINNNELLSCSLGKFFEEKYRLVVKPWIPPLIQGVVVGYILGFICAGFIGGIFK